MTREQLLIVFVVVCVGFLQERSYKSILDILNLKSTQGIISRNQNFIAGEMDSSQHLQRFQKKARENDYGKHPLLFDDLAPCRLVQTSCSTRGVQHVCGKTYLNNQYLKTEVVEQNKNQKPGDHPNFRKNALGAERPFSELWESSGVFSEQLSELEIPFSEYEIPFSEWPLATSSIRNPQFSEQLSERFPELPRTHPKDFHLPLLEGAQTVKCKP